MWPLFYDWELAVPPEYCAYNTGCNSAAVCVVSVSVNGGALCVLALKQAGKVSDDPAYFAKHIAGIYAHMRVPAADAEAALATVRFVQARGAGYAQSTEAELRSIAACARATGLLLDPVYTGKAYHALLTELASGAWAGRTVAFLHTGGLLGAADAAQQLLAAAGQLRPLSAAPLLPDEASGSDSDAA